ncbi:MAG: hypothetical protein AAF664_22690 [Planctomycetota bacterium]
MTFAVTESRISKGQDANELNVELLSASAAYRRQDQVYDRFVKQNSADVTKLRLGMPIVPTKHLELRFGQCVVLHVSEDLDREKAIAYCRKNLLRNKFVQFDSKYSGPYGDQHIGEDGNGVLHSFRERGSEIVLTSEIEQILKKRLESRMVRKFGYPTLSISGWSGAGKRLAPLRWKLIDTENGVAYNILVGVADEVKLIAFSKGGVDSKGGGSSNEDK